MLSWSNIDDIGDVYFIMNINIFEAGNCVGNSIFKRRKIETNNSAKPKLIKAT